MNDYWNNPPEQDEEPTCPDSRCQGFVVYIGTVQGELMYRCEDCDREWAVTPPPEPGPEPDIELSDDYVRPDKACPHGKEHSCDACDHASDIAYDSAREQRR